MKKRISPNSQRTQAEVSPYRITQEIRAKIDEAKMDGTWECEVASDQFDFLFANQKEHFAYWENVKVIRKGKRDEVEARETETEEDLVAREAEISRKRRAEIEAQPGRLKRPVGDEYHPKVKPE
jgi:hypothetical protein